MLLASTTAWYAARAGGMVAFALLSVGVLLGLGLSGRARLKDWPRFALEDVHRFVGLLAGTFVAVHVLVLLLQGFVPFSVTDLVIPFAASFKPIPTALGVVSMELMVALALTNRYRRQLPYRFWRRAHYANFAVWLFALVHGIASGTDTGTVWGAATVRGRGRRRRRADGVARREPPRARAVGAPPLAGHGRARDGRAARRGLARPLSSPMSSRSRPGRTLDEITIRR